MPVAMAVRYPFILVTNPEFPARTTKDLIDLAKKNPDRYTFASTGVGSVQRIGMEMFMHMAGIKLHHISYKGGRRRSSRCSANQASMILSGFRRRSCKSRPAS